MLAFRVARCVSDSAYFTDHKVSTITFPERNEKKKKREEKRRREERGRKEAYLLMEASWGAARCHVYD